jgi:RNA polymerase sigma factor (sigma-70 family)
MLRLRGARSGVLMQQIGRLFLEGTAIGSSEGELLDRFVRARDESAFEALVARHGPMVLGVCRQLLRDPNDVDDAFQATFLVLVRKAATLRRCDLLGNWLYGVAMRVAMRARSQAARRMGRFGSQGAIEKLAAAEDVGDSPSSSAALVEPDRAPWLHQEVSYLPEKYRTPVVLCYFEGLTHDEAASRMGCPLGTVKGRLSRARDLLRRRLTRRGVALSAAALASQLTAPHAQAAVPAALELATTRAALAQISSAGASLAWGSSISIPVTALTEGVLHAMIWNQVKVTAGALCLASTLAVGVVVGATQLAGGAGDSGATQVAAQTSKASASKGGGSAAKSTGAASSKAEQSISPDLLSQINGTNRTFELLLSRERNLSGADIDRMSEWSNLMMSADLVLATGDEDRVAARKAHRDRMKKLHEALKTLPASAQNQTVNAQHAQEKLEEMEGSMSAISRMGGPGGRRPRALFLDIATTASELAILDKNPKSAEVRKKLEQPISISFNAATPLEDALNYIKQATTTKTYSGIPIYLDPYGLNNDADATMWSTVKHMELEGIPLKTTLRLMLKQLDLAYCVRDGVLIISSPQGIFDELMEMKQELNTVKEFDEGSDGAQPKPE